MIIWSVGKNPKGKSHVLWRQEDTVVRAVARFTDTEAGGQDRLPR